MKASELRIGNLLKLPGNNITEISVDSLKEIQSGIHPYQTIPITEKWLHKFGFGGDSEILKLPVYKSDDLSEERTYLLAAIDYGYERKVIRIIVSIEDWHPNNETPNMWYWSKIKYVHQLQNLYFALTGNELTIKP